MDIGVCFNRAMNTFKQQPAPLVLGCLVIFVTSTLVNIVTRFLPDLLAPLVSLALSIALAPMGGSLVMMALAARRGQTIELPNVFDGYNRAMPFIVVNLATMAGLIACGVGVLVTSFLFMFSVVLVSLGADFGPALTRSKDIALAHTGDAALLLAVIVGLVFAGILLFGIGLLVALPLSILVLIEGLEQLEPSTIQ